MAKSVIVRMRKLRCSDLSMGGIHSFPVVLMVTLSSISLSSRRAKKTSPRKVLSDVVYLLLLKVA
ncbi:hypothetical protein ATOBIA_N11000 [Atopobiaceae bacterium P1]|nr:hypothetical protein ATOBIA_N11000 [Atopobiaceae bacterium P1]